jgi:hypothetical protein
MPTPAIGSKFALKRKFLADHADVSLDLASPDVPLLMKALQNPALPLPPGAIALGDIKATVDGAVDLGRSTAKVTLKGHAGVAFGLGVFIDGADAIKAVAPSPELSDALALEDPESTRYVAVRAAYDLGGAANGSIALGAGASGSFGVEGSTSRLFAVVHRFEDREPAVKVFGDLFDSWALPRSVDAAEDLAPGTWLITEVDASIALQMGVQAGYDFSWLREIPGGALKGDIGLRVQMGASAVFGFEAAGKYAVVLARESDDQKLRLRLYKLAKKGWNFALDARVGIKAQLPAFFDRGHHPEDLVAAIFGLNENQIIDVLRETRQFVNSNVSLQDKLAGVLMKLGGKALDDVAGLSPDQIRKIYETGRQRLVALIERFDKVLATGGHELTSLILSLSNVEVSELRPILQDIANATGEAHVQQLVRLLVARAGFERTPIARLIEAAVGPALGVVNNTELARQVRDAARVVLDLLEGNTLQELLDFVRKQIHVDRVKEAVDKASFDRLDNLLKERLAAFLGKQEALIADLQQIQAAGAHEPADATARPVESTRFQLTAPLGPIEADDLRWYLESYYLWPTGVFKQRAEQIEKKLPQWGQELYRTAVGTATAQAALTAWQHAANSVERWFSVLVDSDPPEGADEKTQHAAREASSALLRLPWELLYDGRGYLFQGKHAVRVRRRLPNRHALEATTTALPIRILLVSPRPEDERAGYIDHRVSALPLVEAVEQLGALVTLTVLTPPTLPALEAALQKAAEAGQPFHVVHFDGHGIYDREHGLGGLCFEDPRDLDKLQKRASQLLYADQLAAVLIRLRHHRRGEHRENRAGGECEHEGDDSRGRVLEKGVSRQRRQSRYQGDRDPHPQDSRLLPTAGREARGRRNRLGKVRQEHGGQIGGAHRTPFKDRETDHHRFGDPIQHGSQHDRQRGTVLLFTRRVLAIASPHASNQ